MDRYPPIAEHGLIGDLQTAALVTTDGTVDWWCCPRFDFPQAFTHLSLINAAINLDHQLDHGAGRDPVQHPGAQAAR
jgi:GH15 family glucan-1,4-alpha-glucosidase